MTITITKADVKAIAQMLFAAGRTGGRAVSTARQEELSTWFAELAERMPNGRSSVITGPTRSRFRVRAASAFDET